MEKKKKKKRQWKNEGEEKERTLSLAYSPDPPGFICVHNSFSFCLSPSFPLPLSFFRAALSLTQTPTRCNRTADKYTDSCNHQIILLHLKRNGTPTALTYATVNYSIQRTRGEPPATELTTTQMQERRREQVQRDVI